MSNLDKIFELSNLRRAYRWILSNPDGSYKAFFRDSYSAFAISSDTALKKLVKDGLSHRYVPSHASKVMVPKEAHPVVPGSPICGMRMPSAAGARGHSVAASDRRLDSPAGPKGRRNCHRHADKQLKAPEKLETHPPFQISLATPIC